MDKTSDARGAERKWLQVANREVITPDEGSGFRWAQHGYPEQGVAKWNYHPEYELHAIGQSEGRWVIGDKVGVFAPGHVALIGPHLPHDWVSFIERGEYIERRDTLIQFTQEWFSNCAAYMPELNAVKFRLEQSRSGLVFQAGTAGRISRALEQVGSHKPLTRLSALVTVFQIIADAPEDETHQLGARYSRPAGSKRQSMSTVDVGLDYILKNINGVVTLEAAAQLANMSESAFSRYFKRASGLTFTEMTIKLRISHACRLLELTDESIMSIAGQVGFTNQSNFNRQFRRITGMTPRNYRTDVRKHPLGGQGYHY